MEEVEWVWVSEYGMMAIDADCFCREWRWPELDWSKWSTHSMSMTITRACPCFQLSSSSLSIREAKWHSYFSHNTAHNQYPHHGSRDPRAAIPRYFARVLAPHRYASFSPQSHLLFLNSTLTHRSPKPYTKGSGGAGHHRGGDGVIRDIEFLEQDMAVSILSERRVHHPYGLEGGEDGACGLNLWIRRDPVTGASRVINLGGKNTAIVGKGDRIVICTPGGGGYGVSGKPGLQAERDIDAGVFLVRGSVEEYRRMGESA
ncbi:Hydantoinase B/oxoprolinase-domain-containing protein [Jimgerdemannia flammicorona]|uniref:Hydantoinase B/oxoprolinase-domain-containing protein n=1 Tax=Jimgerdemannia flammicorona TaxID=994334 RepID=A0A433DKE8_9FUNG|nr:Hydantoinase B/oxoprolinase-domain-containing protein [Jimgerdemannia flammicorona]